MHTTYDDTMLCNSCVWAKFFSINSCKKCACVQLYCLVVKAGCLPAGAVGALAAFQAVQGSSEAQLLRLLGDKASAILEAGKHLNWLPDQPPRTALGHSAYIQDVLPFLKVCTAPKHTVLVV